MRFRSNDFLSTASRSFPALKATALSLAVILGACGGGGGSAPAALDTKTQGAAGSAAFTITSDDYGLQKPTYLAATRGGNGLTVRAAIASSMTDPEFRTVARLDIPDPALVAAGVTYSLGGDAGLPSFPGTLYVFNGHPSTVLKTTGGTIAFTSYGTNPGEPVAGSFQATILDDDTASGASYTIAARFSYRTGEYGPILPAPVPVPSEAVSLYSSRCASCHTLGGVDVTPGNAPELALKGGQLQNLFPFGTAGHFGITLTAEELSSLKILLNAN